MKKDLLSKRAGYIDDVLMLLRKEFSTKPSAKPSAPAARGIKDFSGLKPVPNAQAVNLDVNTAFKIICFLESRCSFAIGDSGTSFGATQVQLGSFLYRLSRDPQTQSLTGMSPGQLRGLGKSWTDGRKKFGRANLWLRVPVDAAAVRQFMKTNPKKVVDRLEGVTVKYKPEEYTIAKVYKNGSIVGYRLDLASLQRAGLNVSQVQSQLQRIISQYITGAVVRNAIIKLYMHQEQGSLYSKFKSTFTRRNVSKNQSLKNLTDRVSQRDFMTKINYVMKSIKESGYNPNAPGAFNIYQLLAIANASGAGRVRQFLKYKKTFSAGNLQYLTRANPVITKVTGISSTMPPNKGLSGFPSNKTVASLLSKRADDPLPVGQEPPAKPDWPIPPSLKNFPSAAIIEFQEFMDRKDELISLVQNDLVSQGKPQDFTAKDLENGLVYYLQQKYTAQPTPVAPAEPEEDTYEDEFADEPTKMDWPIPQELMKYPSAAILDYQKIMDRKDEFKNLVINELNKTNPNEEFTDEDFQRGVLFYISQKYGDIIRGGELSFRDKLNRITAYAIDSYRPQISKRIKLASGAMYFPAQYAEDLRSGKREMTIRPGDLPVQVEEVTKCMTYGGSPICDVKITSKETMSLTRIRKAFGKRIATSLEKRFGPNKRFVVIRFHLHEPVNAADDGGNKLIISKDDIKLTRRKIKDHYSNAEVLEKIKDRLADASAVVYIGSGKNEKVLKKSEEVSKYDECNRSNPEDYFYWIDQGMISMHQVYGPKTQIGSVSIIPKDKGTKAHALAYSRELAKLVKKELGAQSKLYEIGDLLHHEILLPEKMSTSKLRKALDDMIEDTDYIICDVKDLKTGGSLLLPGALHEETGHEKRPLKISLLDDDYDNNSYGKKLDTRYESHYDGGTIEHVPMGRSVIPVEPGAYHASEDGVISQRDDMFRIKAIWKIADSIKMAMDPDEWLRQHQDLIPEEIDEFGEEEDGDENQVFTPAQKEREKERLRKILEQRKLEHQQKQQQQVAPQEVPEQPEATVAPAPQPEQEQEPAEPEVKPEPQPEPEPEPELPSDIEESTTYDPDLIDEIEGEMEEDLGDLDVDYDELFQDGDFEKEFDEIFRNADDFDLNDEDLLSEESEEEESDLTLKEQDTTFGFKFTVPELGVMPSFPEDMSQEAQAKLSLDSLSDATKMSQLFSDPQTWLMLKREQNVEGIFQQLVLPALIFNIGKRWFDIHKKPGKTIGRTPFSLFSEEEIDAALKNKTSLDETVKGKSTMATISKHITDAANAYFSKSKIGFWKVPIGAYLYRSLHNNMLKEIADNESYKMKQLPICAVCVEEESSASVQPVMVKVGKTWKCPTCEAKLQKIQSQDLKQVDRQIQYVASQLEEASGGRRENFLSRMEKLQDIKSEYQRQVGTYARRIGVPYMHTWCPSENCPGKLIPLTFVDWSEEHRASLWDTDKGKAILARLEKNYGITAPWAQENVEQSADVSMIPEKHLSRHVPPQWMWEIPFVCPYDNVKFIMKEAWGKGHDLRGGLLWEPKMRMSWIPKGGKTVDIDSSHRAHGISTQDDSHELLAYQQLNDIARNIFLRKYWDKVGDITDWEMDNPRISPKKKARHKIYQGLIRRLKLYDTMRQFSARNPEIYVAWLADMKITRATSVDPKGRMTDKMIVDHPTKAVKESIYAPIMQQWFRSMINEPDGFNKYGLQKWIINSATSGIPSYPEGIGRDGSFFISKVQGEKKSWFECNLLTPKEKKKKIGVSPRMINLISLYALSDGDVAQLPDAQKAGTAPVDVQTAVKLKAGKDNRVSEYEKMDFSTVYLDPEESKFVPDQYVLVQAHLVPGTNKWPPIHKNLLQAKVDADGEDLFFQFGQLARGHDNDPQFWKKFKEEIAGLETPEEIREVIGQHLGEAPKASEPEVKPEVKPEIEPVDPSQVIDVEELPIELDEKDIEEIPQPPPIPSAKPPPIPSEESENYFEEFRPISKRKRSPIPPMPKLPKGAGINHLSFRDTINKPISSRSGV